MAGNRWTREQDLAVLYLRHRGVRRRDPEIGDLARAMNRTEAAIWMRKGNFDSLDPLVPGVGLRGVSNLTRSVWEGYLEDPERILAEAPKCFPEPSRCRCADRHGESAYDITAYSSHCK